MYKLNEEDRMIAILRGSKMASESPELWYLVAQAVENHKDKPKPSISMVEELKRQLRMV